MKKEWFLFILIFSPRLFAQPGDYLGDVKREFQIDWPANRTVNIVFHGHSLPSGYFQTPIVNSLAAYPHLTFVNIKNKYPKAILNVIRTAIGGENSEQGLKRFEKEVLNHKPDIVFIDYALNDRRIGLEKAKYAWRDMIILALDNNIKVILMTPSPDKRNGLFNSNSELELHALQIKALANEYNVGIIDSYGLFKTKVNSGTSLEELMSSVNHPNEAGHLLIADAIFKYF